MVVASCERLFRVKQVVPTCCCKGLPRHRVSSVAMSCCTKCDGFSCHKITADVTSALRLTELTLTDKMLSSAGSFASAWNSTSQSQMAAWRSVPGDSISHGIPRGLAAGLWSALVATHLLMTGMRHWLTETKFILARDEARAKISWLFRSGQRSQGSQKV